MAKPKDKDETPAAAEQPSLEEQVAQLRQQLAQLRDDFNWHQHARGGKVELHQGNPIAEIEEAEPTPAES